MIWFGAIQHNTFPASHLYIFLVFLSNRQLCSVTIATMRHNIIQNFIASTTTTLLLTQYLRGGLFQTSLIKHKRRCYINPAIISASVLSWSRCNAILQLYVAANKQVYTCFLMVLIDEILYIPLSVIDISSEMTWRHCVLIWNALLDVAINTLYHPNDHVDILPLSLTVMCAEPFQ